VAILFSGLFGEAENPDLIQRKVLHQSEILSYGTNMLDAGSIAKLLGYESSPNYLTEPSQAGASVFSIFRQLRMIPDTKPFRVDGLYVYDTQLAESKKASQNIALCVATVDHPDELNNLRQIVWNTGAIPFLLALSDGAAHLYETFSYKAGASPLVSANDVLSKLSNVISAEDIDTGRIWESELAAELHSGRRVDMRLLENLKTLRTLLNKRGMPEKLVHKCIGKFIYLRYLMDRGVLSHQFLEKKGISLADIFGKAVTVRSFKKFSQTIEERFNGKIFEINFRKGALDDETVQLLARVFCGEVDLQARGRDSVEQLCMEFMDYQFDYIPVELLSKVYELFLSKEGKASKEGAYYTPEHLAEYVLNDLESEKPFEKGMKALDPSCGSGIFLSLIYRRLIEKELRKTKQESMNPARLRELLETSIFGVEKDPDACQIAAFSLILTMLHYIDPPELHRHHNFKFPKLVGENILLGDFFDEKLLEPFIDKSFDWVAGNPPWKQLKGDEKTEFAGKWIVANSEKYPVADYRLHDAFAWHVQDFISDKGVVGLVMPTSSLLNDKTEAFRKAFFAATNLLKVTNFSNVRRILFEGRAIVPPSAWIYGKNTNVEPREYVKHFAPKTINLPTCSNQEMWTITVNEADVQYLPFSKILDGNALHWKVAQWGSLQDISNIRFLSKKCHALARLLADAGFDKKALARAPEFRSVQNGLTPKYPHLQEYKGFNRLDERAFNAYGRHGIVFSLPDDLLSGMDLEDCYCRRGGGLKQCKAPHLFISSSWGNAFVFSNTDFIIPPGQFGMSGRNASDVPLLKALAVYFASSLVKYWMFFNSPKMGNYDSNNVVNLRLVYEIPVPSFDARTIACLANLYDQLEAEEASQLDGFKSGQPINVERRQSHIDKTVFKILDLPPLIETRVSDFVKYTVHLSEHPNDREYFAKNPSSAQLKKYGKTLVAALDGFAEGECFHKITIRRSPDLTCCEVTILKGRSRNPVQVEILKHKDDWLPVLKKQLNKKISPRVYLQRNLRVYSENTIQLFKPSREIDWVESQAYVDSGLIISEILTGEDAPC